MEQRRAGWYDDPEVAGQLRYFDGILWTTHVVSRGPHVASAPAAVASPQVDHSTGYAAPGSSSQPASSGAPAEPYPPSQPSAPSSPWGSGPSGDGSPGAPADPYAPPDQQRGRGGRHAKPQTGPTTPGVDWAQRVPGAYPERWVTADGAPLAGWFRRAAAYLLDLVIVALLTVPFSYGLTQQATPLFDNWLTSARSAIEGGATTMPTVPDELLRIMVMVSLIGLVLHLVYEVGFLLWRGQTPGRVVTGISVRGLDRPGPPNLEEVARRSVVKFAPRALSGVTILGDLALLFGIADALWPLGDKRRQALHDKVGKTSVVLGRQPPRTRS